MQLQSVEQVHPFTSFVGSVLVLPEGRVPIPQHFMIMHVEQACTWHTLSTVVGGEPFANVRMGMSKTSAVQEIKGDDTPVLQSVLQADWDKICCASC